MKERHKINEELKKWRQGKGISLYAAAKESRMRLETVRKLENGKGKADSLIKYLKFVKETDKSFFEKLFTNI